MWGTTPPDREDRGEATAPQGDAHGPEEEDANPLEPRAMEEEGEEEELEVVVEVEDEEVTEVAEQLGQPAQHQPQQQPGQQPQQQPRQQLVSPEPAGSIALSPGQRLAQLESRLGTDAPQGANVLQRIIALEANMDVTAIGSFIDRISAIEAKANEFLL